MLYGMQFCGCEFDFFSAELTPVCSAAKIKLLLQVYVYSYKLKFCSDKALQLQFSNYGSDGQRCTSVFSCKSKVVAACLSFTATNLRFATTILKL